MNTFWKPSKPWRRLAVRARRYALAGTLSLLALPLASFPVMAAAQEDELKDLPGYFDFGELSEYYGEPKVMINIGGMLLGFVSAAAKDDPEAAEILRNLEGVRINVYEVGGETAPAMEHLREIKGLLKAQNWEPIVQVNEDDEQVQIFVKLDGEVMQGLTVMAVDGEEAVFLNILGMIDPDKLSAVMDQFDVNVDVE
jgi:hypothetical protein